MLIRLRPLFLMRLCNYQLISYSVSAYSQVTIGFAFALDWLQNIPASLVWFDWESWRGKMFKGQVAVKVWKRVVYHAGASYDVTWPHKVHHLGSAILAAHYFLRKLENNVNWWKINLNWYWNIKSTNTAMLLKKSKKHRRILSKKVEIWLDTHVKMRVPWQLSNKAEKQLTHQTFGERWMNSYRKF